MSRLAAVVTSVNEREKTGGMFSIKNTIKKNVFSKDFVPYFFLLGNLGNNNMMDDIFMIGIV